MNINLIYVKADGSRIFPLASSEWLFLGKISWNVFLMKIWSWSWWFFTQFQYNTLGSISEDSYSGYINILNSYIYCFKAMPSRQCSKSLIRRLVNLLVSLSRHWFRPLGVHASHNAIKNTMQIASSHLFPEMRILCPNQWFFHLLFNSMENSLDAAFTSPIDCN